MNFEGIEFMLQYEVRPEITLNVYGAEVTFEVRSSEVILVKSAPKPRTKRQMMSFQGTIKYCRSWISNYALFTAPLSALIYDTPLAATEPLVWTL